MEQNITIRGVNINYRFGGQGRPMILMHGWGCDHSTLQLFERVGRECRTTYNIDIPGFGKSEEPPTAWTVDEYVQMLEEFVKELKIENPIILGHSFGGRIGILYASRNPVERLILVDAAGVKPVRTLKYYLKVNSYKFAKIVFPKIVGEERAQEIIDRMRSVRGSSDYNNASPIMRQVLVKAINTDLCYVMPKIKAPTLLIWGEKDTATPMRDAKIMKKLIPNSGLVSFPGAGHFSFVDNPFQAASMVRRFISTSSKIK